MTISDGATELLVVANKPGLTESGGGHGAKGVDFQRWWAILRMVEMEKASQADYLLLFEAVQDVTELDSSSAPTKARIYQVKKKDRGEWSWSVLTGTSAPKKPKASNAKASPAKAKPSKPPSFEKVSDSALGKLHLSLAAFNKLDVDAYFISNAGCDIPLASGANAATAMPCSAEQFAADHADLLGKALHSLSKTGELGPDLKKISVKKVPIHPDAPADYVVKAAFDLILSRSATHAGQANSFVDALFMKIAPLGRHTDTCATYDELVKQRGFSKEDFSSALSALQAVPDHAAILQGWLQRLEAEGLGFMEATELRMLTARILGDKLLGAPSGIYKDIDSACDKWVETNAAGSSLRLYLEAGVTELKVAFPEQSAKALMAHLLIRALKKCVDPN